MSKKGRKVLISRSSYNNTNRGAGLRVSILQEYSNMRKTSDGSASSSTYTMQNLVLGRQLERITKSLDRAIERAKLENDRTQLSLRREIFRLHRQKRINNRRRDQGKIHPSTKSEVRCISELGNLLTMHAPFLLARDWTVPSPKRAASMMNVMSMKDSPDIDTNTAFQCEDSNPRDISKDKKQELSTGAKHLWKRSDFRSNQTLEDDHASAKRSQQLPSKCTSVFPPIPSSKPIISSKNRQIGSSTVDVVQHSLNRH